MRKIISKEAERKKQKKKQFIVSLVLIFVMLSSIVGYSLSGIANQGSTSIKYNGLKFVYESNYWNVEVEDFQFSFAYNPNQVAELNSSFNLLKNYEGKPLYISSENSQAEAEIYKNLFYQNQIAQRVQYACLENETCDGNLPVKNCEDNFIIIKESENNKVKQENNCIFIEGNKDDLIKLSDSFLFKITGIQ